MAGQRGSDAYLQAYQYVTSGNPERSRRWRRRRAWRYLKITASPPLSPEEVKGAKAMRRLVKHDC